MFVLNCYVILHCRFMVTLDPVLTISMSPVSVVGQCSLGVMCLFMTYVGPNDHGGSKCTAVKITV